MRNTVSWLLAVVVGLAIVGVASGQSRAADLTTLISFNNADGAEPFGGLIADAKGNLFGTTGSGGGSVFEIVKIHHGYASTPTTLVSFSCAPPANCAAGYISGGSLIADARGNLFGTTRQGGANDRGAVFEIIKTASGYASAPTTLVSFCALANCADGEFPNGGPIMDADGNLFGTASAGGTGQDGGTVFEIIKTASGYASAPTTLVSFCALVNCVDGGVPNGGLIIDADGNLFGTAGVGGAGNPIGGGTVFEIIKTASGYVSTPTTLISFCARGFPCADGLDPSGSLIADANGNLFGTTGSGGANGTLGGVGGGTVFEIIKTASGYASTRPHWSASARWPVAPMANFRTAA